MQAEKASMVFKFQESSRIREQSQNSPQGVLKDENKKPTKILSTEEEGFKSSVIEQEAESSDVARIARDVIRKNEEAAEAVIEKGSSMNERSRELKTRSCGLGFSSHELVPICRKPGTWESTKRANNSSGTHSVKSKGSDLSISSEMWSTPSTALKMNRMEELGFSLPLLIIFVPLGSLLAVPLLFLPLSPLASSLFEFDAIAPFLELSQVERYGCGSREMLCGRVVWKLMIFSDSVVFYVGFTWLSRVGLEKPNPF